MFRNKRFKEIAFSASSFSNPLNVYLKMADCSFVKTIENLGLLSMDSYFCMSESQWPIQNVENTK